jgi:hypothetical protein
MNAIRFRRSRRGVSVIEIVVASFAMLLVLAGVATVSSSAITQWSRDSSKLFADNDASLALQKLSRGIRDGITASVDSTGTVLSVVMPTINSSGDYNRYSPGLTTQFYLSSGKVWSKVGSANATQIGKNIKSLNFSVNGVQVTITVDSLQQYGTKTGETSMSTQIALRNATQ